MGSSWLRAVAAHGGSLWPEVDSSAEVDTVLARRPERSHPLDIAECPGWGMASNDSSGNEERGPLAPLPRREGVSGPPQSVAGIGLAQEPMPAPSLSRWMPYGPMKVW